MDLPQALLDAAAQPVQGAMTGGKLADHFALVHHQLLRLRAALAFATVTGRAIILPPIWCQLDKYWAPLWDGELPRAACARHANGIAQRANTSRFQRL